MIIEADAALSVAGLRRAGVRAVALVAGEYGSQIGGERATVKKLRAQHYPAQTFVMPKAGHYYSANIADIMREAIDWAVANGET